MKPKKEVMKELSKVFNRKIIIQKLATTTNENGFQKEKWIDWKPIWAKVNNLHGKEFWEAKAVQAETTVVFEIRYSKEIEGIDTKKHRLLFDSREFNIVFIDNVLYQNRTLKIKAMEVK